MEFYEVVKARRSVRKYKVMAVEKEKIDRILEAARLAPSAANIQPCQFFVVQSTDVKRQLKAAYAPDWFHNAPVIIVGCVDTRLAWRRSDGKSYADVDLAIAMEHIILAATAEGLGTCWIGAFNPEPVRQALQLPAELEPVAMTPLGHPEVMPAPKQRKPLTETVKFVP